VDVQVNEVPAVDWENVEAEMATFEAAIAKGVNKLDAELPGEARSAREVAAVLRLAAFAHGEWVRIHPFIDGNGRTSRCWVLWITTRYLLPPFLAIRPRPADRGYVQASAISMATGRHEAMTGYLIDALTAFLEFG
jgi:Fic family protein